MNSIQESPAVSQRSSSAVSAANSTIGAVNNNAVAASNNTKNILFNTDNSSTDSPLHITSYSGVDVYEILIGGIALMRRCSDNWVNSTQILKAAKIPKAQRTRILEKEIQTGHHQKIQGGNGRFQGTWVPLEVAQSLAEKHGLQQRLAPILNYVPSSSNPLKRLSKNGARAQAATPAKRKKTPSKDPAALFSSSFPASAASASSVAPNATPPAYSQPAPQPAPQMAYQNYPNRGIPTTTYVTYDTSAPPSAASTPHFSRFPNMMVQYPVQFQHQQLQMAPQAPEIQQQPAVFHTPIHQDLKKTPFLNAESIPYDYSKKLIEYFGSGIEENIPPFLINPPPDFGIDDPIDTEGHSPLHWAAAMGNLKLVQLLVSRGANTLAQNALGLNPLCRLVTFNNCCEKQNFPQILQCLKRSLFQPDKNDRLILHYLCQFSEIKSKAKSILYYFDVVMDEIRVSNEYCNQQMLELKRQQVAKSKGEKPDYKDMEVSVENEKNSFMQMILNHKDMYGDTPLHLAIRSKNERLVKLLIENGSDFTVVNASGEAPFNMLSHGDIPLEGIFESTGEQVGDQTTFIKTEIDFNKENFEIKSPNLTINTPKRIFRASGDDSLVNSITNSGKINNGSLSFSIVSPMKNINFNDTTVNTSADESVFPITQKSSAKSMTVFDEAAEADANDDSLVTPTRTTSKSGASLLIDTIGESVSLEGQASKAQSMKQFMELKASYANELDKLEKSFAKDIVNWDSETSEVKQVLHKVNTMLGNTEGLIRNKLASIFDVNNNDDSESLKAILDHELQEPFMKQSLADKLKSYEDFLIIKSERLVTKLERSQAKAVADFVTAEEQKMEAETPSEHSEDSKEDLKEKAQLMLELSKLQLQRADKIQSLINQMINYTVDRKMNTYRELISISCDFKIESIDDLIDGIEQALLSNSDSTING